MATVNISSTRQQQQRIDCFLQSRLLHSQSIDTMWMESLFRFMNDKPKSAAYSMAFAIACIPTYSLTVSDLHSRANGSAVSAFVAARELLDLMDDSIRNTDTLNLFEMHRSRSFNEVDFVEANEAYVIKYDSGIVPLLKRYKHLFPSMIEPKSRRELIDAFVSEFLQNEDTRNLPIADIIADLRVVHSILNQVNEKVKQTAIRIPANAKCSKSIISIDLHCLDETTQKLSEMSRLRIQSRQSHIIDESVMRQVATCLVQWIIEKTGDGVAAAAAAACPHEKTSLSAVSDDNAPMGLPYDRAYTILEAYASYAPVVYRYESLAQIITKWKNNRDTTRDIVIGSHDLQGNDDDEYIRGIMLPTRAVWQSGTSQILWLVLHTLAALTVERRNHYIMRLLVICSNLSFFIWCSECALHWAHNHGDDYFRHVSQLPSVLLQKLPIDILLLRCHNTIQANSSGVALPVWTVAHLCVDFRDFASRCLLRRANPAKARNDRLTMCQPLFRVLNVTVNATMTSENNVAAAADRDDRLLILALSMDSMTEKNEITTSVTRANAASLAVSASVTQSCKQQKHSPQQQIIIRAVKNYYGEQLMRQLWHYVDSKMTVPICVMWQ